MRLPSQSESVSRPIINVQLVQLPEAPLACLVDSGAIQNRFPKDFADAAGIALDEPDDTCPPFWAAGTMHTGVIIRVQLRVALFEWEAPVCFVDDWPYDFGLLGDEGFFRWFHVCFHAADEQITLELAER